jgi:hypothetical protein
MRKYEYDRDLTKGSNDGVTKKLRVDYLCISHLSTLVEQEKFQSHPRLANHQTI